MKTVDARKQACPKPVIMTKKALEENIDNINVIVDNKIAKSNVIKLCTRLGYDTNVKEKDDSIYINITRTGKEEETRNEYVEKSNIGYVFGSNILGKGSEELGKILVKGFVYTLTETKPYPSFLIFLNSGIELTTKGSECIEDLKVLEKNGVKILSCGTCLDFFNLKDKLLVGEISNMYDIVETMSQVGNTIML